MFKAIGWVVHPSLSSVLIVAFVVAFSFIVQKIVYNLYLHPLAGFAGPKVAGVTRFWRAYVECILNRSFVHVLEELHKTYGTWAANIDLLSVRGSTRSDRLLIR